MTQPSNNTSCGVENIGNRRTGKSYMSTKAISVVTSARSDFGLLLPLMEAIEAHPAFDLTVLTTGVHFLQAFGHTIAEVRDSSVGNRVAELPCGLDPNIVSGTAMAMGTGTIVFAEHFAVQRPDLLVILGDRFDALPAALSALPCQIPIAHISGGEITEGAIDDYVRHVLTKLSHLHFAATPTYARRIIQLGEEPDRVFNVGEPGLDIVRRMEFLEREEFFIRIGMNAELPLSLFTYHPETANPKNNKRRIQAILEAAASIESQVLFTYPNGDPGSNEIVGQICRFGAAQTSATVVPSLGRTLYLNALNQADCVVGNSSSGIVETASFKIPAVNIGDRQKGRIQPDNVINTDYELGNLTAAWNRALSQSFRQGIDGIENPYGDGRSVEKIMAALEHNLSNKSLWHKRFYDSGDENAGGVTAPVAG